MPKGYVYILECADGSYYTGSTVNIDDRLIKHQNGQGANHTKKRLPVKLVYLEEHQRIDDAFYREKQIQGWSRKKKQALIDRNFNKLPELSLAYRDIVASRTSATKKASRNSIIKSASSAPVPKALEGTSSKFFRSNGKLLITGEYIALDGAKVLALPTKFGQNLTIEPNDSDVIEWKSFNELGEIWFEDRILIDEITTPDKRSQTRNDISQRLIQILNAAQHLNPNFLNEKQGYDITTQQDFNRLWGLGTSSTLINNIANWANVDAYQLLKKTFGGSGYDIACAQHNLPITFQRITDGNPLVATVDFNPDFKHQLYFVYLNQKQNSRDGISAYRKLNRISPSVIVDINRITEAIIASKSVSEFEEFIDAHETIISKLIDQETVKSQLFKDFKGSVKSLGAWGGDFVLATSETDPAAYFKAKGFDVIIPYENIIL